MIIHSCCMRGRLTMRDTDDWDTKVLKSDIHEYYSINITSFNCLKFRVILSSSSIFLWQRDENSWVKIFSFVCTGLIECTTIVCKCFERRTSRQHNERKQSFNIHNRTSKISMRCSKRGSNYVGHIWNLKNYGWLHILSNLYKNQLLNSCL